MGDDHDQHRRLRGITELSPARAAAPIDQQLAGTQATRDGEALRVERARLQSEFDRIANSVAPTQLNTAEVTRLPPGYSSAVYAGTSQPQFAHPHTYQPVIAPKQPGLMLLASFFIPGLGTMMNGETGKGIGILIGWILSAVLTLFVIGIFTGLGFWIWGMVDAYQGAQRWNARHGIIS